MPLTDEMIRGLLRLKTDNSIADKIADRQTEVIRKVYNYLTDTKAQNNLIYIADEVGLGKTYIALGIAMLFRHHAPCPQSYKDVVIVPKKNLQEKWQKEATGFIANNYLDAEKKIALKAMFDNDKISKDELQPLDTGFTIFRMSSFSAVNSERAKEKLETYAKNCDLAKQIVENQFFNNNDFYDYDILFAYWLNATNPQKIDCLIIDEAHNYKHGLSDGLSAPLRNRLTAFVLGAVKHDNTLKKFSCLEGKVHFPLAKKTICLSATPKDRNLLEIKHQLDCFTDDHPLTKASELNIKDLLKTFLIRGNLFYQIEGETVSRHACRYEHRQGNVTKKEDAPPFQVEDDFAGAFWQLIQYQSIKHLNSKNNATFEMGMLAGFETYKLDVGKKEKAVDDREYEETATKNTFASEDKAVIELIVNEYQKKFEELPPHPKQTRLEESLIEQLKLPEKSLVFVRRVHTAAELTARLLRRYEQYVVELLQFKGGYSKHNNPTTKALLEEYRLYQDKELIIFFKKKLITALNRHDFFRDDHEQLDPIEFCFFAYQELEYIKEKFNKEKKSLSLSLNINKDLMQKLKDAKKDYRKKLESDTQSDEIEASEPTEMDTGYFFNFFFFKKGRKGEDFRKKIDKEKLFDLPDNPSNNDKLFLSQLLTNHCKKEYDSWKQNKTKEDMSILRAILIGVFGNGSGLLPAFVAYSTGKDKFITHLLHLMDKNAPFKHITEEIKTILRDFDLIVSINFSHRKPDKIKKEFKEFKLSPIIGQTGKSKNRSKVATQFRLPGFPYILVATDIFREGEDLHTYCQNVYHYGIAWNPSGMEQRTGRIDRINSLSYRKLRDQQENIFDNQIQVFYPYLQHSIEVNQVSKLFKHMNQFMESFNEIDEKKRKDSLVSVNDVVTLSSIPLPIIPKRGRFEIDDFADGAT
jgi:Type III restriction enzyme, res subunit/Helicase conserved C-terminal domain